MTEYIAFRWLNKTLLTIHLAPPETATVNTTRALQ